MFEYFDRLSSDEGGVFLCVVPEDRIDFDLTDDEHRYIENLLSPYAEVIAAGLWFSKEISSTLNRLTISGFQYGLAGGKADIRLDFFESGGYLYLDEEDDEDDDEEDDEDDDDGRWEIASQVMD
jgi:hypothetical protein